MLEKKDFELELSETIDGERYRLVVTTDGVSAYINNTGWGTMSIPELVRLMKESDN